MIRIAQIMGKMNSGGVEAVVMNYYRKLDKTKFQFDFIIDNDSMCPQEDEILKMGGRVYRISPYENIFHNCKDLKRIFKENNYLIVHSELTTMSTLSLMVAKRCKIPVRICHAHNTFGKGEYLKNILKNILKPIAKRYATNYFACSQLVGEWMFGKKEVQKGNVTIINNAIDVEKFRYDEEKRNLIRKQYNMEDKIVIGHIGRFVFQKNHEFLIKVFEELIKRNSKYHLFLIGEGPLLHSIESTIQAKNIQKNITIIKNTKESYLFYQLFDVFILPSRYEGLPVVGVESQIASCPIVCSENITKETKFTDLLTFVSLNEDIGTWCDIIEKQLSCKRTVVNCDKFDIKVQTKLLEQEYEKIISSF